MYWRKKYNSFSISRFFDQWIFQSYAISKEHLGFYRILYALFNLVFLFGFNFNWLSHLPHDFYAPPLGIAALWNGFPDTFILYGLNTVIVLSNFALLIGYRTFWSSILHSCVLLFAFSLVFSLGNIYHIILWIILPFVMAFSNWGASYSWDARQPKKQSKTYSWPIVIMSLFTGFAFFTAGFAKLLGGWLTVEGSAVWQYFINVRYSVGRDDYLSNYVLQIESFYLWEMLDWLVVWFETLFLFAVFRVSAFRFFCILGVFFHLGVLLILNISFSIHLIVFLLFIPWSKVLPIDILKLNDFSSLIEKSFNKQYWFFIFVLIIIIYLALYFYNPFPYMVDGPRYIDWITFGIALFGLGVFYFRGR